MTGPGGGLIFFVDYQDEYATYDYLEVAPVDMPNWSASPFIPWATATARCGNGFSSNCETNSIYTNQSGSEADTKAKAKDRGLFGGKAATEAIVARHDAGSVLKDAYAAGVADAYVANGKSDWWLPSIDELELIGESLVTKGIGTWFAGYYYSSSEYTDNSAWAHRFYTGVSDTTRTKSTSGFIRPVRAF
jgi:hypothetical protein